MSKEQPDALKRAGLASIRLAREGDIQAAETIRAQADRIAELEAQLEAIGAGGVEPLRKPDVNSKAHQDAADARRWRAVRQRHAMKLCRLATNSSSYSSDKAPSLIDAWADMAAAQIEAFDAEHWQNIELPGRISELERELRDDATKEAA